jgi:hypothetical protein
MFVALVNFDIVLISVIYQTLKTGCDVHLSMLGSSDICVC